MQISTIQPAPSLGIPNNRTPWRSRLRSILSGRWYRKNEVSKHDSLYPLGDRLLANVGLYREHRNGDPQNRTDQQQGSPVPATLLAMWMPRI
jgi:hypothetical protein